MAQRFCMNCGTPSEEGQIVCSNCGASLRYEPVEVKSVSVSTEAVAVVATERPVETHSKFDFSDPVISSGAEPSVRQPQGYQPVYPQQPVQQQQISYQQPQAPIGGFQAPPPQQEYQNVQAPPPRQGYQNVQAPPPQQYGYQGSQGIRDVQAPPRYNPQQPGNNPNAQGAQGQGMPPPVASTRSNWPNALAFVPMLFWLPLVTDKNAPDSKFYANQGLILLLLSLVGSVVIGILSSIFLFLRYNVSGFFKIFVIMINGVSSLLWVGISAVTLIGIIKTLQGEKFQVPILGDMFTILK